MYQYVVGRKVMIVGDLHISDRVIVGKHINYLKNCFDCLADIRDRVLSERPCAVVFLGDIVGTQERNIKSREVLAMFCRFFREISEVAKIFCVRGNHDSGDFPEFQFLSELGLFETSVSCGGYFDFYGTEEQRQQGVPEVRFHLVDFGCERNPITLSGSGSNVVLAHNNFTINGVTNWYQNHDGIELGTLDNFDGVCMVISGHIHTPSPDIVSTYLTTNSVCCLFYTGCPTRPAERYDSCWYVDFTYDEATNETNYDAIAFNLPKDIFYEDDKFVEDMSEEDIAEVERTEALREVLDEILTCHITTGDLVSQVQNIPNASNEAKRVACHYLRAVLDS